MNNANGSDEKLSYTRYPSKVPLILKVKREYRQGITLAEIGRRNKLSKMTVYNYIRSSVEEPLKHYGRKGKKDLRDAIAQKRQFGQIPLVDNPISFCEHEKLLGLKLFPMQKLILKCFYGMDLDDEERKKIVELEKRGRTTYRGKRKYRELVVMAGMKAGKTPLAGMVSCYGEYELWKLGNPCKHYGFLPGKKIHIINVAVNAEQAQSTIFSEIRGHVNNTEYYRLHRPIDNSMTKIEFDNDVIMLSGHSNSSSLVGKIAKQVSFDELARFIDKGGKYSADAVYYSLIRSVEPFGEDGRITSISSPMFALDFINQLYKKSSEIDNMLGFWLPTWEMNPKLPYESEYLQSERKKNPEAFWRDFGARPSHSSEAYFKVPERIDEVFASSSAYPVPYSKNGRLKDFFKGKTGIDYFMHADPSVKNDSFGIALAHAEDDIVIADLVHHFSPKTGEINLDEVLHFILEIANRFRIAKFTYDTWQATSIMQSLAKRGIESSNLYIDKIVYDRLKEFVYANKLRVHECHVLQEELKGLELVSGKKVDHPKKGSKDIADALAGAVWNAVEKPSVRTACMGWDPPEYKEKPYRSLLY